MEMGSKHGLEMESKVYENKTTWPGGDAVMKEAMRVQQLASDKIRLERENSEMRILLKDVESFMHKTNTAIDNLTARMDRIDTAEHGE